MVKLIAIDPGLRKCGYTLFRDHEHTYSAELPPKQCIELLADGLEDPSADLFKVYIEKPVAMRFSGAEITETAIFAGVACGLALANPLRETEIYLVTRSKVRAHYLTGDTRKNGDAQIRKAMLEIYGKVTTGDGWQSLALANLAVNFPLKVAQYKYKLLEG